MTDIVRKADNTIPDIYMERIAPGKKVKIINHKEEQKKGNLTFWAEIWAMDEDKNPLWFKAEDGSIYKNYYYQRALTREEILDNLIVFYKKYPDTIFNPKLEK